MIALNFGCGTKQHNFEGYEDTVNIDLRDDVKPDMVSDVFSFPKPEKPVGLIYSSHFLEHFSVIDARRVLRKFHELLEPGGKIWMKVPNLEHAAIQILQDGIPSETSMDILYGHQEYETNFHKCGFTPRSFKKFVDISGLWEVKSSEAISNNFEIELKAEKVCEKKS
jgi:hypothetical protein